MFLKCYRGRNFGLNYVSLMNHRPGTELCLVLGQLHPDLDHVAKL